MSSIHATRAKQWGFSTFMAEWLSNVVDYCKTAEGKQRWKKWVLATYGPDHVKGRMKLYTGSWEYHPNLRGEDKKWDAAAKELGVNLYALQSYHRFAAQLEIGVPPRTKQAIRRRRGECSIDWLARSNRASLDGHKVPKLDFNWLRAIAISEYDKVKDTMEEWRINPNIMWADVLPRASAVVPSRQFSHLSEGGIFEEKVNSAFTSALIKMMQAHLAWSEAAELFEDLTRRDITTPAALERAYKKDPKLLWSLASCLANIEVLYGILHEQMALNMTWCKDFRPYFTRCRLPSDIMLIEVDNEGVESRWDQWDPDQLARLLVKHYELADLPQFFEETGSLFREDPSQAKRLSATFFDDLGDVAPLVEFRAYFLAGEFGVNLRGHLMTLASRPSQCLPLPDFSSTVLFTDPGQLKIDETEDLSRMHLTGLWGPIEVFSAAQRLLWQHEFGWFTIARLTRCWLDPNERSAMKLYAYRRLWDNILKDVWTWVHKCDRPDSPGRAAVKLGVGCLYQPDAPPFKRATDLPNNADSTPETNVTSPSPATTSRADGYVEAFSVATPGESVAKSGHAYLSEIGDQLAAKEKVKTRKAAVAPDSQVDKEGVDSEEDDEDNAWTELPDVLPSEFKLGKKTMKIFHTVLEIDKDDGSADGVVEQKSKIRWEDFERAMKRIGFEITQTAGSSVRFDPPAKRARPITFHRPHPNSTMSPDQIRWVGRRLRRTYGWTESAFQRVQD